MSAPAGAPVADEQQFSASASAAATGAPLRKLTTGLLVTYRKINERYYQARKERQRNEKKEADYQVSVGDVLGGKYRVKSSMGKGSFGQVVSAEEISTGTKVAVKVIKNREAFRRQAKTEIKLLELLNARDPYDQWCVVHFLEHFEHNGHVCLVFEHLAFNLYELLRRTHFRGVALSLIRKFARQILTALAYLSLPEIDVIHCDLKPENILFRVPHRSALKVIDFGSSCQREQQQYKYIQSRFYRSPEVILELGYTQAIDMWSLGCILVELHTGMPLFSGRDEADQMRRFVALKGIPPRHMLAASRKTDKYFDILYPPGVSPPETSAMEVDGSSTSRAGSSATAGIPPSASGTAPQGGADMEDVPPTGAAAMPVEGSVEEGVGGAGGVEGEEWYDSSDYEEEDRDGGDEREDNMTDGRTYPVMGGPQADQAMDGSGMEEGKKKGGRKGSRGNLSDTSTGAASTGSGAGAGAAGGGGGTAAGRRVRRKDVSEAGVLGSSPKVGSSSLPGRGGSRGRGGRGRPLSVRATPKLPLVVPAQGPVYRLKASVAAGPNAKVEGSGEGGEAGEAAPKSSKPEPPVYTDLQEVLGVYTGGPGGRHKPKAGSAGGAAGQAASGVGADSNGSSPEAYLQFLDLVERMLDYDPTTRIKPMEAMAHPFLRADLEEAARVKAAELAKAAGATGMQGSAVPTVPEGGMAMMSLGGAAMGGVGGQAQGGPAGMNAPAGYAQVMSMGGAGPAALGMSVGPVPVYGVHNQWGVHTMPLQTGLVPSSGPASGRHSHRGSFQGTAPGPHGQGTPLASPGGTLHTTTSHSNNTSAQSSPRQGAHAPVHSLSTGGSSVN